MQNVIGTTDSKVYTQTDRTMNLRIKILKQIYIDQLLVDSSVF